VDGIWLREETGKVDANGNPILTDKEEILRTSTHKYLLMTDEYCANGGDGYDVFKDKKRVIDDEAGLPKSTLIRQFISGAFVTDRYNIELLFLFVF
jgi:5'-nucleotidase